MDIKNKHLPHHVNIEQKNVKQLINDVRTQRIVKQNDKSEREKEKSVEKKYEQTKTQE